MLGRAMQTVRQAVLTMPAKEEIGDDAFHRIEEESDRLEIAKREECNRILARFASNIRSLIQVGFISEHKRVTPNSR